MNYEKVTHGELGGVKLLECSLIKTTNRNLPRSSSCESW